MKNSITNRSEQWQWQARIVDEALVWFHAHKQGDIIRQGNAESRLMISLQKYEDWINGQLETLSGNKKQGD